MLGKRVRITDHVSGTVCECFAQEDLGGAALQPLEALDVECGERNLSPKGWVSSDVMKIARCEKLS